MDSKDFFSKEDITNDDLFYSTPRLVKHIDDNACEALTSFYRNFLKPDSAVLDLMSSWVSHLPEDIQYSRCVSPRDEQGRIRGKSPVR